MIQKQNLFSDITSSIVVFFVALPLCLGIALASGAPILSGLIAGICGGIIVGILSGSHTSVSGPAAGLTIIVLSSIQQLGSFEIFLLALLFAGLLQIAFGLLGAGIIGNFIPSAVIKGMLSAIGLILIFKQLPHAVGYDLDFEGDENFIQNDNHNTFSELLELTSHFTLGAVIIAIVTFLILFVGEKSFIKNNSLFKIFPISLIAVFSGTLLSIFLNTYYPAYKLESEHLVQIPDLQNKANFMFPDFTQLGNIMIYILAFKIALVASLETLLSIEATDKLDISKRITPTSRELIAQGSGNMVSALLGGLPITAVIVRSSANIVAGNKTKLSAILHGILLVICVILFPNLLNKIPLSTLAVLLIFVGFKLTKPILYKTQFKEGLDQFLPFLFTIIAILFSDLLIGVGIGLLVSCFFILRNSFKRSISITQDKLLFLIKLNGEVSFLNKAFLRDEFEKLPNNSYLIIDGTAATYIDKDIIEVLEDFKKSAPYKSITVEMKNSASSLNQYFRKIH